MTAHLIRGKYLPELAKHAARLDAHLPQIADARRQLRERAQEQRDATVHALDEAEAWMRRHPDNHLIARRVEVLLHERGKLDAVLYRLTRPQDEHGEP